MKEKKSLKVSIIVPVHNAGERLYKCLDTLVNQTLREIEIILVLDCPTDGSDKIAKEYAAKDDRIIVLENETNLHIGNSRNRGLEIARGEYIGFSDHDDYRELTMYEELYSEAIVHNAELVLGNMLAVEDRYEENYYPILPPDQLKEFALTDLLEGGDDLNFNPHAVNILPNLYKNSFLNKHNIAFVDTKICTPEDLIFQLMCLFHVRNLVLYDKPVYFHTAHSSNTGESKQYTHYNVTVNGKAFIYNFLNQNNAYQHYKLHFLKGVKKLFTDSLLSELIYTRSLNKFVEAMHLMKSFPFTKDAYRNSRYSLVRYRILGKISRKMVFFLMKH